MPSTSGTATAADSRSRPDRPIWVDLVNPTQDEAAKVAAEYRVHVPSRESLQEADRQHVRHELPQHAGVSMALGLSVRIGADRREYIVANPLVQATRMVVKPIAVTRPETSND